MRALLLLALVLRLPGLTESLWFDEVYHTHVYFDVPEQRDMLLYWRDVHPPLYALLMLGWTRLCGDGELAVRLPSLLFGLASVALVTRLAQGWLGRRQGWLAGALLAVSPPHIWYSHESKANMMLVCLTVAAVASYWNAAEGGKRRDWWLGGLLLLGALFTHPYAVPVAGALFGWLAWRRLFRPLLSSVAVLGLLWLPLALSKFLVRGEGLDRWYLRDFNLSELYRLLLIWLPHGNTVRTVTKDELWPQLLAQPWPLFVVEGLVAGLLLAGLGSQLSEARRGSWSARLLLLWFGLPLALTLAISAVQPHSYIERNMLAVLPPFLMLLASGARSALAAGALLLLGLAGVLNLLLLEPDESTVFHLKPDWRAAAAGLTGPVFVTVPTTELAYYRAPVELHQVPSAEVWQLAESHGWRPLAPFWLVRNTTWRGNWDEVWPLCYQSGQWNLAETRTYRGLGLFRFERSVEARGPSAVLVDLGGPEQSLWSLSGFYRGEGTFAWTEGPVSTVRFQLAPHPGEYRLGINARRAPGLPELGISVRLNGRELGQMTPTMVVPAGTLRDGENVLELEYDQMTVLSATDSRVSSLCIDWIELR